MVRRRTAISQVQGRSSLDEMTTPHQFVDIDGPVHYVDHGGAGVPVVLVHGLGGSHVNWRRVAPQLAAGHRVLSVDLRGFGLTPLDGHDARLPSQVLLLQRFVSQLTDEPPVIVGNSMGGLVAVLFAARHPDLLAGLVLINPALPIRSGAAISRNTVLRLGLPLIPGLGELVVRHYESSASPEDRITESFQFMTVDPATIDSETMRASIEMARARRNVPGTEKAFTEAMRSIASELLLLQRFRRKLHSIGTPTLLIHGVHDPVVALDSAEWLALERPDWTFLPMDGVGHVPQLETPEAVVHAMNDWIASAVTPRDTRTTSGGGASVKEEPCRQS